MGVGSRAIVRPWRNRISLRGRWVRPSNLLHRQHAVGGFDRSLDLGGDRVLAGEGDVDLAASCVGDAEGDGGAVAAFDFAQEGGEGLGGLGAGQVDAEVLGACGGGGGVDRGDGLGEEFEGVALKLGLHGQDGV